MPAIAPQYRVMLYQFALGVPLDTIAEELDLSVFPFRRPEGGWLPIQTGYVGGCKEEVLEETEEYRIFRDIGGVIQKEWKHKGCIPHFMDFTFKQAKDWPIFKERLQPNPGRIPEDIDKKIAEAVCC